MPEIKSREAKPIPGVEYSEIRIPDEHYLGTGEFTTVIEPKAMSRINPIISNVMNEPYFLLIVNINLGIDQVTALLGKMYDEPPISRKVFAIPKDIRIDDTNDFTVSFREWEITGMRLNGDSLPVVE
ncbi:MAG: hypothetical protein GXP46_03900 [Deferribacteres bacterium]|nr:hypothetical protein [Deferribacteres bacterium]